MRPGPNPITHLVLPSRHVTEIAPTHAHRILGGRETVRAILLNLCIESNIRAWSVMRPQVCAVFARRGALIGRLRRLLPYNARHVLWRHVQRVRFGLAYDAIMTASTANLDHFFSNLLCVWEMDTSHFSWPLFEQAGQCRGPMKLFLMGIPAYFIG
jgi:hypothetical protein